LTGSVQAPREIAEAIRLGVEPGRDLSVARTAEFSKTVALSGVGPPPAQKRDGPV
jgi:hypothetical protein